MSDGRRKAKVAVPKEMREAVTKMIAYRSGRDRAAKFLGVSSDTMDELIHPAGMLQQTTIDRVWSALASMQETG